MCILLGHPPLPPQPPSPPTLRPRPCPPPPPHPQVRKYLDALCVYFWASTQLLFSALTFGLMAFLGYPLRWGPLTLVLGGSCGFRGEGWGVGGGGGGLGLMAFLGCHLRWGGGRGKGSLLGEGFGGGFRFDWILMRFGGQAGWGHLRSPLDVCLDRVQGSAVGKSVRERAPACHRLKRE